MGVGGRNMGIREVLLSYSTHSLPSNDLKVDSQKWIFCLVVKFSAGET